MTIKQQGGIFGRNPTFNDLEVDGTLTVGGNAVPDASTLLVDGDIGSTVQAYDADTAKLDVAQTFTAAQTFNSDVTLGNGAALAIDDQDSIIFGTFASGSTGTLLQGGTSTSYLMYVNGRLRASIDTSGNLDMSATNSGNIILKSGNGIDFSATAGTGTSELFDDYEEGTWDATLIGTTTAPTTPVTATARYTKVGRKVTVEVTFSNVNTTGASGNIRITGLPFSAGSNAIGACAVSANISSAFPAFQTTTGNTTMNMIQISTSGGIAIPSTTNVYIFSTMTYTV